VKHIAHFGIETTETVGLGVANIWFAVYKIKSCQHPVFPVFLLAVKEVSPQLNENRCMSNQG
jgi:hypothetical protein